MMTTISANSTGSPPKKPRNMPSTSGTMSGPVLDGQTEVSEEDLGRELHGELDGEVAGPFGTIASISSMQRSRASGRVRWIVSGRTTG